MQKITYYTLCDITHTTFFKFNVLRFNSNSIVEFCFRYVYAQFDAHYCGVYQRIHYTKSTYVTVKVAAEKYVLYCIFFVLFKLFLKRNYCQRDFCYDMRICLSFRKERQAMRSLYLNNKTISV